MRAGIPKERNERERRVAGTPKTVERLVELGFEVVVERGAGVGARLDDEAYEAAGARLVDVDELWEISDVILKVRPPTWTGDAAEVKRVRPGQVVVSLVHPAQNEDLVAALAERRATVLALDQIPRISRAQKMDVLSSMANIAGYRAVIEAANLFGSFFGGQITAAGKTRPARVLVIGAGVAGLAAIANARALGAEVRAFDVRLATREQVESLGATFLELQFDDADGEASGGYAKTMSPAFIEKEMALFAEQCKEVDIVITTALIPGKPAPLLITKEMVESMRPGSVIVDLAAQNGGNCGYTEPDRTIEVRGVTVIGYTDLTSRLATHASQFFGTNVAHLLEDLGGGEAFRIDTSDEIVRNALVVHDGRITWPPPPEPATAVAPPPDKQPPAPTSLAPRPSHPPSPPRPEADGTWRWVAGLAGAVVLGAIGTWAPTEFIQHFTVFVLACVVGWQVVWNVTPALHTPLMSVTNAISGIIVVGGILQASSGELDIASMLGAVAILVASINIAGGFLVTSRMLQMFRREG